MLSERISSIQFASFAMKLQSVCGLLHYVSFFNIAIVEVDFNRLTVVKIYVPKNKHMLIWRLHVLCFVPVFTVVFKLCH